MIKIGLIGEDPTDTGAIKHLMKQKFGKGFHFFTLSKKQTGSKMLNQAAIRAYNFEIQKHKPNHIIVIMDADAIITEKNKIQAKQGLYNNRKKEINCNNILLLNIYELEALALADIDSFNEHYNSKVKFTGSVSHKEDPKKYLKNETDKKYKESDCPEIFKHLQFDTVMKNCSYFEEFIANFEDVVKN